jgi:hypothetical protein
MTVFVISKDNYITQFDSLADATSHPETEHFSSAEELQDLASNWPAARLVEIWKNLPGSTPVKKFTDRATAVVRIWKAIQELGEPVESAPVNQPPLEATSIESACEPNAAPREEPDVAAEAPNVSPIEPVSSQEPTPAEKPHRTPREGSKTAIVLALLKGDGGTTVGEIREATGWQAHSVRGFLSGTIVKKLRLPLVSNKSEEGERRYSLPG